jgi:hypothetical protein
MSAGGKLALGVFGVFLALWLLTPLSFGWALLVLIGLPVAGYFMLDDSRRQQVRGMTRRQIGR